MYHNSLLEAQGRFDLRSHAFRIVYVRSHHIPPLQYCLSSLVAATSMSRPHSRTLPIRVLLAFVIHDRDPVQKIVFLFLPGHDRVLVVWAAGELGCGVFVGVEAGGAVVCGVG